MKKPFGSWSLIHASGTAELKPPRARSIWGNLPCPGRWGRSHRPRSSGSTWVSSSEGQRESLGRTGRGKERLSHSGWDSRAPEPQVTGQAERCCRVHSTYDVRAPRTEAGRRVRKTLSSAELSGPEVWVCGGDRGNETKVQKRRGMETERCMGRNRGNMSR